MQIITQRLKCFWFAILTMASLIPSADAENFNILVDHEPSPASGMLQNVSSGDSVVVFVSAESCYCCEILAKASTSVAHFGTPTSVTNNIVVSRSRDDTRPPTGGAPNGDFGQRVCFQTIPDHPGASFSITIPMKFGTNGDASADYAEVRCNETTLFGNYNTSLSPFSFLELTNTDRAEAIARVRLRPQGTIGTAPIDFQILLSGHDRVDLPLHERLQESGGYGLVSVCHDSTAGTVRAVVSQYQVTQGNSAQNVVPTGKEVLQNRRGAAE